VAPAADGDTGQTGQHDRRQADDRETSLADLRGRLAYSTGTRRTTRPGVDADNCGPGNWRAT
jgi:hypothetical protein